MYEAQVNTYVSQGYQSHPDLQHNLGHLDQHHLQFVPPKICYGHNNSSEGFGEIHPGSNIFDSAHAQSGLKNSSYRQIMDI